ncbi:pyrroloquinoline quinone biosynthesis protein PqqB [Aquabacter sp. L1I39]|uniref:pyrroloquinoline quinone biosynthesis protein PqqB n=1 Tax=Aquabacter sp. L1I39 TaxID=2820278 RepID=UPI001ADA0FFF|nr:pyrroloquinoline quinone biosynthesis protein PqqB [Aquabacter sp. L1I39]QTL04727.1 pyrroloquinoline quinone biosynthesis protein PqqB [Aquabacter sp. L1I39]
MRVLLLGSAAGGGVPQWNCRCTVCELARAGDPRVRPRTQCGFAVSADGTDWVLVNASPDLRQQLLAAPALAPTGLVRSSPIRGVVLTNGELDHVVGLLCLRERHSFALYATAETHAALDANPIFEALGRDVVTRVTMSEGAPMEISGLTVEAMAVAGKVPLYLEGKTQAPASAVALHIRHAGRVCVIAPNCAAVTHELRAACDRADLFFFDGTTFTDDEMIHSGLSEKSAGRMGHVAMDGPRGSLAAFRGLDIGRRVYVHINNSNPVLIEDSPENRQVRAAGWEVGHDGMEFAT